MLGGLSKSGVWARQKGVKNPEKHVEVTIGFELR